MHNIRVYSVILLYQSDKTIITEPETKNNSFGWQSDKTLDSWKFILLHLSSIIKPSPEVLTSTQLKFKFKKSPWLAWKFQFPSVFGPRVLAHPRNPTAWRSRSDIVWSCPWLCLSSTLQLQLWLCCPIATIVEVFVSIMAKVLKAVLSVKMYKAYTALCIAYLVRECLWCNRLDFCTIHVPCARICFVLLKIVILIYQANSFHSLIILS